MDFRLVERAAMVDQRMFAEDLAVIGSDNDHRVIEQAADLEGSHQLVEMEIEVGDGAVVLGNVVSPLRFRDRRGIPPRTALEIPSASLVAVKR